MPSKAPLAALATLIVAASWAQEPPVIARWSFDETAGTQVADSGPNGLHGELKGAFEHVPGLRGGALKLAAEPPGWVELPRSPVLDLTPPFTLGAWIKPLERSGQREILCKLGDVDNAGYRFRFYWQRLVFELGDGAARTRVSTPAYSVPAGFWCHVAASHDGTTVTLFLNAEETATQEAVSAPAANRAAAVIGNFYGRKNAYPFVGLLDELTIVGAALDGEGVYRYLAQAPP